MIHLKTEEEIALMNTGGKILKKALKSGLDYIRPGVTTSEIDKRVEETIIESGGQPGFKKVKKYNWATCVCVNEEIVHTPPSSYRLKENDIVTIDAGVFYRGFHTDSAKTVRVLSNRVVDNEVFLQIGKKTLKKAIKKTRAGNRVGHISREIEEGITSVGYSVIHKLTGHGVGRELHEDPLIPGFVDRPFNETDEIKNGMVLAIEVIYSQSSSHIRNKKGNKWSIETADKSISACFEHTVAVWSDRTLILT